MLIIPIKKAIRSILLSWNLSIFVSIFNLLPIFYSPFRWREFEAFVVPWTWILLLHKCSIWIPIFGHLSNVYRTQFLDRSQPGERTIYTNRLWTRTSVVSWSTRAKREFQERVLILPSQCGGYVRCPWLFYLSFYTTLSVSLSFWQLVSNPFHPHLIDHPSSRSSWTSIIYSWIV